MRSPKILAFVLTAVLALPATMSAQGHQDHHPQTGDERSQVEMMTDQGQMMGQGHGMIGSGMMGMMGMMSRPNPSMILMQKDVLDLEPSQVERLESLQQQLADLRQSYMNDMTPLRDEMSEVMHSDQPDLSRYESVLERMAAHQVKMQVEIATVSQNSLDVLTPKQRSNVRFGMNRMGHMRERGMMQGGMMNDAEMMMGAAGCPMMNQMKGDEAVPEVGSN